MGIDFIVMEFVEVCSIVHYTVHNTLRLILWASHVYTVYNIYRWHVRMYEGVMLILCITNCNIYVQTVSICTQFSNMSKLYNWILRWLGIE